jgi:hypothetical protein
LLESCPERERLDCETRVLGVVIDLAGSPSLHVVGWRAARALFEASDPILEIVRLSVPRRALLLEQAADATDAAMKWRCSTSPSGQTQPPRACSPHIAVGLAIKAEIAS